MTTQSTGITSVADPLAGKVTGTESSLSNWAGPYVTEMLGRGKALADMPYDAYTGPLTAGPSNLQNQAFQGLANLTVPTANQTTFTPGSFTNPGTAQQFMNPYVMNAINPQIDELTRQSNIRREGIRSDLAKAGAFGGGRQAIMESELDRNLQDEISQVLGTGLRDAFTQGANQFNTEQALGLNAAGQNQQYGLAALNAQQQGGQMQRDIEQQGVAADLAQFEQERMFPYKQVQFMQSLLQGMPLAAQNYNYQAPTGFNQFMGSTGTLLELLNDITGVTRK